MGGIKLVNRIFVDMDGVVADFDRYAKSLGLSGDEIKKTPGTYQKIEPIPGAIGSIRSLIGMGFDVWLATKPPTGIPYAYADKVQWVLDHLPELKRKIILTHDKGLLGESGDYLIDDRPHKAGCLYFKGTLIFFRGESQWPAIVDMFREIKPRTGRPSGVWVSKIMDRFKVRVMGVVQVLASNPANEEEVVTAAKIQGVFQKDIDKITSGYEKYYQENTNSLYNKDDG